MEALYNLKEKLWKELEEISREKRLSQGSLENAHKLTDTIKNILKIISLEEQSHSHDGGYSQGGNWRANMEGEYGRGSSHRRRDSMGRYSRDDGYSEYGGNARNYSRDGYSRDSGRIMQMMKGMLDDAGNDREREILHRCIEELKTH